MPTAAEIVAEIKPLGSESYKRIIARHGAKEPFFGVKIEHLKKIQKRIKKDYQLALDLYDTGISDAMYLAGLIADDAKMTKRDLERWAKNASWHMLAEYTVAGTAAGSPHGWELARKWIDTKQDLIASAGWATLSGIVATRPDDQLDLDELKQLLKRVERTIHDQPNYTRYTMNGFVIAVGCYVEKLSDLATKAGEKIGTVHVDMGETACQVPSAPAYIQKVKDRGTLGKKRKTAKC